MATRTRPPPPLSVAHRPSSSRASSRSTTALIDAKLAEQLAATPWPGEKQKDAASGEAVGRAVGAAVVAYAATDNFEVLPLPPMPVGPGYWFSDSAAPPFPGTLGHAPVLPDLAPTNSVPAHRQHLDHPAFRTDLAEIR